VRKEGREMTVYLREDRDERLYALLHDSPSLLVRGGIVVHGRGACGKEGGREGGNEGGREEGVERRGEKGGRGRREGKEGKERKGRTV